MKAPRTAARTLVRTILLSIVTLALGNWAAAAEQGSATAPRPGAFAPPVPKYSWTLDKSVMIPMRDGVSLATDLYRPVGAQGALAVIFIKPGGYGKHNYRPQADERAVRGDWMDQAGVAEHGNRNFFRKFGQDHNVATWFAAHGYVVAVQDARGRFESGGAYTLAKNHKNDVYDTVEWLAAQSWSNKHVGMFGCSYGGEVQLYQAAASHPALKAIAPQAAGTAIGSAGGYYSLAHMFDSGALPIGVLAPWYHANLLGPHQQKSRLVGISDEQWHAVAPLLHVTARPKVEWGTALWTLPELEIMRRAGLEPGGIELTDWRKFVAHFAQVDDPWWDQFDFVKEGSPISVPALFTDAWYDLDPRLSLYLRGMYEKTGTNARARANQFLIVAPTVHCGWDAAAEQYFVGPMEVGDARFGHLALYLSWFDHWLRGVDNGIEQMPKIQYFVIGRNEWRATDVWPPVGVQPTKLFLGSRGRANSQFGDGTLDWDEVSDAAPFDAYTYDPANPVPTAGSPFCDCSEVVVDQRAVASRDDVLVYTTPPFESAIEITGPVELVVHVSATTRDTDLFAKLVEVYPDGRAFNIYEAARRLRFRDGRQRERLMAPGQIYRVALQLTQTSRYLRKGHRLRLQVTSSSFPAWGRNLNTGAANIDESAGVVAGIRLHHSPQYPSHLLLPLMPQGAGGGAVPQRQVP